MNVSIIESILTDQSQEELSAIEQNGSLITTEDITYVRMSLKRKRMINSIAINSSITIKNGPFNQFRYNLSERGRDFYRNLPDDWKLSRSYSDAYDYFERLTNPTKWIGKATYRGKYRQGKVGMNICPLNAMVAEIVVAGNSSVIQGKCFIENAQFDFQFLEEADPSNKFFSHHCTPVWIPQEIVSRSPTRWL